MRFCEVFILKTIDYIFDDLKIVQDDEHLKYGTDELLYKTETVSQTLKTSSDSLLPHRL